MILDKNLNQTVLSSFKAGSILNARIFWLSERWFLGSGVDVCDSSTRQDVESWLLSTFAVSPIESLCQPGSFGAKQLGADRYGGSRGTLHGGSG